jgi:acetate kinase
MRVLVLNAGSATLKATVLDTPALDPRFERTLDWRADLSTEERDDAVAAMLAAIGDAGLPVSSMGAVGHRVVHGGERFTAPTLLDDAAVDGIEALSDLARLHNPPAVATIRAARQALPAVPHVAAFDTAFHATLPEAARRYPVPDRWFRDLGVRRYGFHGLAVTWAVRRAAELLDRPAGELRLVVAHLGGGASVTAVDGGRSVDTSMGLTPMEGLMMATRSGSIDPGAILHVLRHGLAAEAVEEDLDHRSGLLGVSGRSGDVRALLAAASDGDASARLALEMFARRAAAGIAAVATALPALDGLVFSGGIGEHAGPVRERIVERLGTLGLGPLPPGWGGADAVHQPADGPAVLIVHAREDVVIAGATAALVGA